MDTKYTNAVEPALQLKKILKKEYGNLIHQIICYGSRITQNNIESDYDILILTNSKISWQLEYELSKIIVNYGIQNDIVFDPQFFFKDDFENKYKFLPYVKSVNATGVAI